MTHFVAFTHSSTPILEAWLIKGLRYLYSKRTEDKDKLRDFYKEACENEFQVSHMTLNEALRETATAESGERDSRIRPVHSFGDAQFPKSSTSALSSSVSTSVVTVPLSSSTIPVPCSINTSFTTSDSHTSVSTTSSDNGVGQLITTAPVGRQLSSNKRSKFGFFNMFETGTVPISKPSVVRSTAHEISTPSGTFSSDNPQDSKNASTSSSRSTSVTGFNTELLVDLTSPDKTSVTVGCTNSNVDNNPVVDDDEQRQSAQNSCDLVSDNPSLLASLVADLVCIVCGRLRKQPQLEPDGKTMNSNFLVECVKCGALYHQLCHKPAILMVEHKPNQEWHCAKCVISSAILQSQSSDSNPVFENVGIDDKFTWPSTVTSAANVGARKRKAGLLTSNTMISRRM